MRTLFRGSPAALVLAAWLSGGAVQAQEAKEDAPPPRRPPEGTIIINLPSADVGPSGTLQLLITHRFAGPLDGSDIHSLFSFDSGADVGLGLSYVPFKDLEIGFLRNRNLEDYEASAKYRVYSSPDNPFTAAFRVGGDFRTQRTPDLCRTITPRPAACAFADDRNSFFVQGTAAILLFSRVRLSVVPTYISRSAQQPFVVVNSIHKDVFNVPFAVSIAVTRSINVQAEVVPRRSQAQAQGVGWITAIEKTVLRHRFSFTAGNVRPTTVDQYIGPDFQGRPHDYYVGFNIIRQWKL